MNHLHKYDVVCAGVATWDTLLTGIEKDLMDIDSAVAAEWLACPGGDAVNASVSLARLGMKTALCAMVGKDSAGDQVIRVLEQEGIDTGHIVRSENVSTSAPVILVDPEGERHIIRILNSGNHHFSEEMVPDDLLRQAGHLHYASANVMRAMDGAPLGRLFRRAKNLGLTTSLDASYDKSGRWLSNIHDALLCCDIFIPSLQEARMYAGSSDLDVITECFSSYPLRVFGVKLGAEGVFVTDFRERVRLPSLYEGIPADTTGAGDAFLAGFTAAWLKEYDLRSCALFAGAQAASVLGAPGASRSAGTWRQAENLLCGKGYTMTKREADYE